MAEQDIGKRFRFPKGQQRTFIKSCVNRLGATSRRLAEFANVSVRTVTDWKREKFLLPVSVARKLSKKSGVALPSGIKTEGRYWYTFKGGKEGGYAVYNQYGRVGGDEEARKKKWREWWEREGRLRKDILFAELPFRKPAPSEKLAEFMGIMMGDGGMSKFQATITLHHIDDLAYSKFVRRLAYELFGVKPSVYHRVSHSVNQIVISRHGLIEYLHSLGLPIGNKVKQQFDIPEWIKENKKFAVACARGLVDTDGSVFTHTYRVNGKWYSYKKLDFSSMSEPLRRSMHEIFTDAGLHARFLKAKSIRLDSVADMKRYFEVISSHNPKHLKRYRR
ncbi:MAG: hypothetical protein A2946_04055 [Candidatus Liptonbacteria bacterium RIFCSPLOWO2_01_FULL_53_13]|uniref:DOD-type homing endonuclease domain-containing protein n=1 Tax=Candidatus Liptonbacteria bacterium RIFCSPLOWO2_01_FULL_53_13 TaxID=1798651 RepID=A0A1G2CMX3_9BACT|nr:MAG: hypothetical protein A2946_04055 [Candidatus Liptonbacteria bacterium RIFCSPLOWO2_01_FULL_53_13]